MPAAACENPAMSLGRTELLLFLFLAVGLVVPVVRIVAAVDAGGRPEWAFEAAGTSRTLWIVLPVVGVFVCFVGLVAAAMWFGSYRARVRAAEARGPHSPTA
jgi:hypothetical protein